jgi:hypothetical protein
MSLPKMEKTDELVDALRELEETRLILNSFGLDEASVSEVIMRVRMVDAEIVAAIHRHRITELYPYFPESFQAEEGGYEAAEKRLRAEIPKEEDL